MDTSQIQPFLLGVIVPVFILVLKWVLDLISSERQYTRDRKKLVLQRQIEVTENAITDLLRMWELMYSLRSAMNQFSAEPSPAQIELLQRAIDGVNRFQKESIGSKNAILLYYDFSKITKDYELEKIDNILLELSDIISRTFARMTKMQLEGYPTEQIKVEAEHIANSYHLYARAIESKMESIVAMQNFLRSEFQKMK